MMKRITLIVLIIFLTFVSGCSLSKVETHHDIDKAINSANSCITNIIKNDYSSAYADMHDSFKRSYSKEKFNELATKNFQGHIAKAVLDSYHPLSNPAVIRLWYKVFYENGNTKSSYLLQIVVAGNAGDGYKVVFIDKGGAATYPPGTKYYGSYKETPDKKIEVTGY